MMRDLITGSPRIVGGSEVAYGTFPYYGIPDRPSCGCTLIHEDILVSAAHCGGSFRRQDIHLGGIERNGNDAKETIRAVTELRHPDYDSQTLANDVMLIRLESPSSLPVATWNEQFRSVSSTDELFVIGYGDTTYEGSPSSKLLGVEVPFVDHAICDGRKGYNGEVIDEYMLCAGEEGADACQGECSSVYPLEANLVSGDSGGPLLRATPDSTYEIVGIVSWGRRCGSPKFPGVYTRISKMSQFIEDGICDLSANPPPYCPNASGPNSQINNGGTLCANAERIQVNGGPIIGTTEGTAAQGLEFCRSKITGGGVWYSFEGTGGLVEANTCSSKTNYDTRLSIMTGACSDLVCMEKDDDACGIQSAVRIPTIPGELYYILVHGFGDSQGDFELLVETRTEQPSKAPASPTPPPTIVVPENDRCTDAISIDVDSTISGTTKGAGVDEMLSCPDVSSIAPGVWYRFQGSGEEFRANTCIDTVFDTQLSVFRGGDCADLVCVGGNDDGGKSCGMGSSFVFSSEEDITYHILVHGYNKDGSGNFNLELETFTPTQAPTSAPQLSSFDDIADFECDSGPLICFVILILRAATVILSSLF